MLGPVDGELAEGGAETIALCIVVDFESKMADGDPDLKRWVRMAWSYLGAPYCLRHGPRTTTVSGTKLSWILSRS